MPPVARAFSPRAARSDQPRRRLAGDGFTQTPQEFFFTKAPPFYAETGRAPFTVDEGLKPLRCDSPASGLESPRALPAEFLHCAFCINPFALP